MTVDKLIGILQEYPSGEHVMVAVLLDEPGRGEFIDKDLRREIQDCWCDEWGVVNIIATHNAGPVSDRLRPEMEG